MKLSLCLLVVLVAGCYEANAGNVCKEVMKESLTFILLSDTLLRKQLEGYNAPQEAVEAKMEVKKCVDTMKYTDRVKIAATLAKILVECGAKGWVEKYFPGVSQRK